MIEARIATYPPESVSNSAASECAPKSLYHIQLNFSLLALHEDPLPKLQLELQELQNLGVDPTEVTHRIERETNKRQQWAVRVLRQRYSDYVLISQCVLQFENSLRRHNHFGLIHGLLLALAKGGQLEAAKESAKKALTERRAKQGGADMDQD